MLLHCLSRKGQFPCLKNNSRAREQISLLRSTTNKISPEHFVVQLRDFSWQDLSSFWWTCCFKSSIFIPRKPSYAGKQSGTGRNFFLDCKFRKSKQKAKFRSLLIYTDEKEGSCSWAVFNPFGFLKFSPNGTWTLARWETWESYWTCTEWCPVLKLGWEGGQGTCTKGTRTWE